MPATTVKTVTVRPAAPMRGLRAGLPIAAVSAVSYGLAGPVAKSLLEAGWSPAAVALVRIGGAALVLLAPTIYLLVRGARQLRGWAPSLLGYGVIAIAGVQLCFFTAIQYAPVSSVLLIEYTAPVLLMAWTWARTRRAPEPIVLVGAAVAVAGLATVIGLGGGLSLSPLGAVWGLGAALCLTGYFVLADSPRRAPALVLTGGGMLVGALVILAAGVVGLLPLTARVGSVSLGGSAVSFLVPALVLALVCAVSAYLAGILAIRVMGTRVASFASLSEVVFALLMAWLLLGEQPTGRQAVGGVIVLVGIVLIGLRGREPAAEIG